MFDAIAPDTRPVFGFHPSAGDLAHATETLLSPTDRARLVVTPNIDHVARLRRSPAFRQAYRRADMILCDGFPVHLYARIFARDAQHVTGCDLLKSLMAEAPFRAGQRLFFAVDTAETEAALAAWAQAQGIADRVASAIPPHGFASDAAARQALADAVSAHGTTLLVMCVGAPQSEIFADRMRASLPPCWIACVGQALKVELGLVRRAPRAARVLRMEWLWRIGQEPNRLARRYALGAIDFALAVTEDLLDRGRGLLAEDV
jgi:N-acetylglucosaminyldiphosphoundecaprenol N-acetyl-beta-D-mannosaminyltransferase